MYPYLRGNGVYTAASPSCQRLSSVAVVRVSRKTKVEWTGDITVAYSERVQLREQGVAFSRRVLLYAVERSGPCYPLDQLGGGISLCFQLGERLEFICKFRVGSTLLSRLHDGRTGRSSEPEEERQLKLKMSMILHTRSWGCSRGEAEYRDHYVKERSVSSEIL